jgi:hypothetical protein
VGLFDLVVCYFCECGVEGVICGLVGDRFESDLLGELEVIVERLFSSVPGDAIGGLAGKTIEKWLTTASFAKSL